jgi:hypothetical protein
MPSSKAHARLFQISIFVFIVAAMAMSLGGCGSNSSSQSSPPPVTLVSIAVTPTKPSIAVGGQQQFTATGTMSDGKMQDLTTAAKWSSSDSTVATITNGGLVTGVKPGNTTISAAQGGINGSTSLTVSSTNSGPNFIAEWLQFLGDGSDGAFNCSSGTCVLAGEHWFSSFNVSTGAKVVSGARNVPIVVRSKGTCTVAGTVSNSSQTSAGAGITVAGDFGAGGGGGGGGAQSGKAGQQSVGDADIEIITGGPGGAAGGGAGGTGGTPVASQYRLLISGGTFWPVGGSIGGQGGSSGGGGGLGGAPIIFVCQSINFTGTIDVSGGTGAPSPAANTGAGGGGGGGYVIFSAVAYQANTGTINLAGGRGGSCNSNGGCGAGGTGGNGWNMTLTIH